ncbi:MAG: bifunctional 2-polyprenyl-6-hydroxyphenol methylase/3-demethylubiquinol 3-O-methyltransferase UbiG [Pseudomonadota bacterium]
MTAARQRDLSVDRAEIDKFEAMAAQWWDEAGPMRPLHALNPARLEFVHAHLCRHFGRDARALRPFSGLTVLDVGCGGGLLSEPMARLGATVTGIDAGAQNIAAARRHAEAMGLAIDYRAITAEALAGEGARFDAVLAMEIIEHVADVPAFLAACRALVRPGGAIATATLNRTLRSYLMAIVGAEHVLRWLPPGTHDWDKFLTPEELEAHLQVAGFEPVAREGLVFDLGARAWRLGRDTAVNYLGFAVAV